MRISLAFAINGGEEHPFGEFEFFQTTPEETAYILGGNIKRSVTSLDAGWGDTVVRLIKVVGARRQRSPQSEELEASGRLIEGFLETSRAPGVRCRIYEVAE